MQQQDALCHALDFVEVVAGVDHRVALGGQLLHGVEQTLAAAGIDTDRGLVEQVQARRLQQADGEIQAALLAPGQAPGTALQLALQAGAGDAQLQAAGALGAAQAVEIGEQFEVLAHLQLGVEGQLLWHQAEAALAVPADFALLQRQHAGQQGEQGGLAGTVAAEQAQALAGLQLQVDALQGRGFGAGIAVGDIG